MFGGRQFTSVVAPEDSHRARELFARKVVGAATVTDAPVVVIDADGERVAVEVSSVPLYRGEHVIGVFGAGLGRRGRAAPPSRIAAHPPSGGGPPAPREGPVDNADRRGAGADEPDSERNHIRHLLRAVGAHSRLEAVAIASRAYLTPRARRDRVPPLWRQTLSDGDVTTVYAVRHPRSSRVRVLPLSPARNGWTCRAPRTGSARPSSEASSFAIRTGPSASSGSKAGPPTTSRSRAVRRASRDRRQRGRRAGACSSGPTARPRAATCSRPARRSLFGGPIVFDGDEDREGFPARRAGPVRTRTSPTAATARGPRHLAGLGCWRSHASGRPLACDRQQRALRDPERRARVAAVGDVRVRNPTGAPAEKPSRSSSLLKTIAPPNDEQRPPCLSPRGVAPSAARPAAARRRSLLFFSSFPCCPRSARSWRAALRSRARRGPGTDREGRSLRRRPRRSRSRRTTRPTVAGWGKWEHANTRRPRMAHGIDRRHVPVGKCLSPQGRNPISSRT